LKHSLTQEGATLCLSVGKPEKFLLVLDPFCGSGELVH